MKSLQSLLITGVVLLGLRTVGSAQMVPTAPHLTFQDRTAFLLTASSIREELQLSDSQRKSLDRYWHDYAQRAEDLARKPNFSAKSFENLERQVAGQSLTVLDAAQKQRLQQLGFQNVGPRALLDEGVAKEFEVGSRQTSIIQGLYDAYDAKLNQIDERIADALGGENIPKDSQKLEAYEKRRAQVLKTFEAERQTIRKTRSEIDRKAVESLNGDQIVKWKKGLGKPFTFVGNNQ